MIFSFPFRLFHILQRVVEIIFSIDTDNIQTKMFIIFQYILKFVLAKQSIIHKYTGKILPIALFGKTAATDESTPPEIPSTTLSFPNCSLSSFTLLSTKEAGDHSLWQPQISRKFSSSSIPSEVWNTSGWNCTPHVFLRQYGMPPFQHQLCWLFLNFSGMTVMLSPCDIQICEPSGIPLSNSSDGSISVR